MSGVVVPCGVQKHLMSYWVLYNLINISESFLPLFW
jgi:hypothetical protein